MSVTYVFDPVDRGGLLLGLSAGQLFALAVGSVLSVGSGQLAGGVGGGLLTVVALCATAGTICWPVRGRTPAGWVPIIAGWAGRRARPSVVAPPPAAALHGATVRGPVAALPPGVAVVPIGGQVGAVWDRRAGTWVGVVAVAGRTLPLLDAADQRSHLARWGALLAGLARPGSPVVRVQWVARVRPAARAGDRDHDVLVAIAVRGRRGDRSAAEVLRRELRLLAGQLTAADLTAGPPFDAPALERALAGGGGEARPRWPRATDEGWSTWRADGSWHATYWVAEWPRVGVGPDFLAGLLLGGDCCRVAVAMGPVPASRAARQVESARTASLADDELRRRAGFLATARRARRADGMARRETELADGQAEYRFSGYVTVSGPDRPTLDARCSDVEQRAHGAGLDLVRLWGQQAEAFTWTLPLARGLR